jgi:hypothetical protein
MGFDTWNAIIDPTLQQSLDVVLHYLDVTASKSDNPRHFLDKLRVEWMTMAKSPDPPEHKYLIVRTKNMENNKVHMFVLDRMTGKADHSSEQPQTKDSTLRLAHTINLLLWRKEDSHPPPPSVTTLILNEYRQSSNSSVLGFKFEV